jgi:hypothetical protein
MQVAIIPPACLAERIQHRQFQMLVPEMLKYSKLAKAYQDLRECYTILDNGMFEKESIGMEELLDVAMWYHCNEVIVPDTYRDLGFTINQLETFLRLFEQTDYDLDLMVVMQVRNFEEIPIFVRRASHAMHGAGIEQFTFGLPRKMNEDMGSMARAIAVNHIREQCPEEEVQIHLLGLSRVHNLAGPLHEVHILRDKVRSIDTDAPFVWATEDASLTWPNFNPERSERYFALDVTNFPIHLVDQNIEALDKAAE